MRSLLREVHKRCMSLTFLIMIRRSVSSRLRILVRLLVLRRCLSRPRGLLMSLSRFISCVMSIRMWFIGVTMLLLIVFGVGSLIISLIIVRWWILYILLCRFLRVILLVRLRYPLREMLRGRLTCGKVLRRCLLLSLW